MRRYPVPLCYLAGLTGVSLVWNFLLSPNSQQAFEAWASTNLANLPSRPVSTMVVSGFIAESGLLPWFVLTSVGLFMLVQRFGNIRTAGIVAAGHVIGTLVSEGIVALRIHQGILPDSERDISDVGPSYIAAAALVGAILYGPRLWQRGLALGAWLVAILTWFNGITTLEVSAVGHTVSMITSTLVGGVLVLCEHLRQRRKAELPAREAPVPEAPVVPAATAGLPAEIRAPLTAGGTPQSLPAASQP